MTNYRSIRPSFQRSIINESNFKGRITSYIIVICRYLLLGTVKAVTIKVVLFFTSNLDINEALNIIDIKFN